MEQKYIVAIEFSGTQVKGAIATVPEHKDGVLATPTVDAIVAEDNTDTVQYGRVQNIINAVTHTNDVIERLKNEPAYQDARIVNCYVGLAGRSLASEKATSEIVLPNEMEITREIVHQLVREASKTASPDKKVLRVLPRKYYVDNVATDKPIGAMGRRLRGDFTLLVCNPSNQRNIEIVLHDRLELNIADFIVTPLALADMVLSEEEKQLGCMLVDIGAQTTTLTIFKERSLQYLVTLPMGSRNITRDIATGMNMTMEKAETVKIQHGNATPDNSNASNENYRINTYIAARAYEIVANIIANISYAGYRPGDLSAGIVLSGRGANLRNFDHLLQEQSKIKVRHASLPHNVAFGFNTSTLHPADYLSLVSLVAYEARRDNFSNCVEFGPETESEVVCNIDEGFGNPVSTDFVPASANPTTTKKTTNRIDDGYKVSTNVPNPHEIDETVVIQEVKEEEPETEEVEETVKKPAKAPKAPKAPKRPSVIDKLRTKITNLLTTEEIDDESLEDE